METIATRPAAQATAPRHDCYAGIHKALRLCLGMTLTRVGSADPEDPAEVAAAARAVHEVLTLSEGHLEKEDAYMHPLLEQARPGSTARAGHDHLEHEMHIQQLRELADAAADAGAPDRAGALHRLYQSLGGFVSADLAHMQHEETVHNAILWEAYSDADLEAVEGRIIASIPPEQSLALLRWFLPAFHAQERSRMLAGMRAMAPAPVFEAALDIARTVLSQPDYAKLARALGVPAVPGLLIEVPDAAADRAAAAA